MIFTHSHVFKILDYSIILELKRRAAGLGLIMFKVYTTNTLLRESADCRRETQLFSKTVIYSMFIRNKTRISWRNVNTHSAAARWILFTILTKTAVHINLMEVPFIYSLVHTKKPEKLWEFRELEASLETILSGVIGSFWDVFLRILDLGYWNLVFSSIKHLLESFDGYIKLKVKYQNWVFTSQTLIFQIMHSARSNNLSLKY